MTLGDCLRHTLWTIGCTKKVRDDGKICEFLLDRAGNDSESTILEMFFILATMSAMARELEAMSVDNFFPGD